MGKCRTCKARVTWVITEHGKTMPIDPMPRSDGNLIMTGNRVNGKDEVHYISDRDTLTGREAKYVSHFATCPNAKQHRAS